MHSLSSKVETVSFPIIGLVQLPREPESPSCRMVSWSLVNIVVLFLVVDVVVVVFVVLLVVVVNVIVCDRIMYSNLLDIGCVVSSSRNVSL